MATILFVTKDKAPGLGLAPLAREAAANGHIVRVVCEGLSTGVWTSFGIEPDFIGTKDFQKEPFEFRVGDMNIDGYIKRMKFDVIVTGLSKPINLEEAFARAANDFGIPLVCYEDIWGCYLRLNETIVPNGFLTLDETAKRLLKSQQRYRNAQIGTFGNLGAMAAMETPVSEKTRRLYNDAFHGRKTALLCAGEGEFSDDVIERVFSSLELSGKKWTLIPRFHQKRAGTEFSKRQIERVTAYAEQHPGRVTRIDDEQTHTTDSLARLADITVSVYSGTLLVSAMANRTPVSIATPNCIKAMQAGTHPSIERYPLVNAGAAAEMREPMSLETFPRLNLKDAQRRYFQKWRPEPALKFLEQFLR